MGTDFGVLGGGTIKHFQWRGDESYQQQIIA